MKVAFSACALAAAILAPSAASASVVLTSLNPTSLDTTATSSIGDPSVISFVNQLNLSVDLYWIGYSGDRLFYSTISALGSYSQNTFLTHPWIVTVSGSGTTTQGTGTLLDGFIAQTANASVANPDVAFITGKFGGAVPESATWALMITGFGAVGVGLRRKRKARPCLTT